MQGVTWPGTHLACAGEVVPRGQGIGVVQPAPTAVGQGLLEQRDRLDGPARRPVAAALFREVGVLRSSGPWTSFTLTLVTVPQVTATSAVT